MIAFDIFTFWVEETASGTLKTIRNEYENKWYIKKFSGYKLAWIATISIPKRSRKSTPAGENLFFKNSPLSRENISVFEIFKLK